MNASEPFVDLLGKSKLYNDYQKAFTDATGLPLSLRPVASWQLPHRGQTNENRFCALMSGQSRSCANCLQLQQKLSLHAIDQAYTATCGAGISESAIPVRLGEHLVGFLQTGQAFRQKATLAQFQHTAQLVQEWGLEVDTAQLKDAYFGTPSLSAKRYASTVDLLAVFAEHLSMLGDQLLAEDNTAELPVITRAKQFMKDHFTDDLSLGQVAKAVNMSSFYFCKLFKRASGKNFTEYLCGVRIDKAKNLLLNRNLRISEIGYEVGFQSLTHFNRVFKAHLGVSPTEYRQRLPRCG